MLTLIALGVAVGVQSMHEGSAVGEICTTAFEKMKKIKEATTSEGLGEDAFLAAREKSFAKVLKLADICLASADAPAELHLVARREKASVYSMSKQYSKIRPTFEQTPASERTVQYYIYLASVLKEASMVDETYSTLAQGAMLLVHSNVTDRFADWGEVQTHLSGVSAAEEVMDVGHPHAGVLLQELVDVARVVQHNATRFIEALRVSQMVAPYNTQLRGFLSSLAGAAVDLRGFWRAHAMPPGVPYTEEHFQDALGAFATSLPRFASTLAKFLLLSPSVALYVNNACGTELSAEETEVVQRREVLDVVLQCLTVQGIVQEWRDIAISLNTTLTAVFAKDPRRPTAVFPFSSSFPHIFAQMGFAVFEAIPELDLYLSDIVLPLDIVSSLEAVPQRQLKKDVVAAKPCWTRGRCTPKVEGFAQRLKATAEGYSPAEEWGRLPHNNNPEAEADFKTWLPWEQRDSFLDEFESVLSADPPMQIDYIHDMTHDVFKETYLSPGRPLVLSSALSSADLKEQQGIFDLTSLLKVTGDTLLQHSDKPHYHDIVPVHAGAEVRKSILPRQLSLFDFAYQEIRAYSKALVHVPMMGPFKKVVKVPSVVDVFKQEESRYWLHAGGSGSGRGMAWEAAHVGDMLLRGRRVWVLLPPHQAVFLGGTVEEDYLYCAENSIGMEVQQLEGDFVFVPSGWSYLWLNVRGAISWTVLFSHREVHALQDSSPSSQGSSTQSYVTNFSNFFKNKPQTLNRTMPEDHSNVEL